MSTAETTERSEVNPAAPIEKDEALQGIPALWGLVSSKAFD